MKLTDFKVLTFDCYGTLIDWETGIHQALRPLLDKGGVELSRNQVLETFASYESSQQARTPGMAYTELLARVHAGLAEHWGVPVTEEENRVFGDSVKDWPAFDDCVASLQYLKEHYALVVLSNTDHRSFAASNRRLGVEFDRVFTAEDIGSYKPDPRNFEHMIVELGKQGFDRGDILHTAQSLFHDHVQATAFGLATTWIDRRKGQEGWGATMPPPGEARIDFHFASLAEMVEAHRETLRS